MLSHLLPFLWGRGEGAMYPAILSAVNSSHNYLVIKVINPVLCNIKRFLFQFVHVLETGMGGGNGRENGCGRGMRVVTDA